MNSLVEMQHCNDPCLSSALHYCIPKLLNALHNYLQTEIPILIYILWYASGNLSPVGSSNKVI